MNTALNTRQSLLRAFSLMILGCVFLFDPSYHLVNLLPDFIGYLFLFLSLRDLRKLNEDCNDSARLFLRLLFLNAAKWVALFLIYSVGDGSDRASAIMTATFAFSVLNAILFIPSWKNLFSGLQYLAMRHEGDAALQRANGKKLNATESMQRFTLAFLSLKTTLSFLPELAALSQYNRYYDQTDKGILSRFHWYGFIGLFRIIGMAITLTVGIVWLIRVCRYFSSLKRDNAYISSLAQAFDELPPEEKKESYKQQSRIFGILVLISLWLAIRGLHFIPYIASGILLTVAVHRFRTSRCDLKPLFFSSLVYTVLSGVKDLCRYHFDAEYTVSDLNTNADAVLSYRLYEASAVVQSISFGVCLVLLFFLLRRMIAEHTGFAEKEGQTNHSTAEVHRVLNLKAKAAIAFGILSAVSGAVFPFILAEYEYLWAIDCAVGILCAILFTVCLHEIRDETETYFGSI